MTLPQLQFKHKIFVLSIFVCVFIGISLMSATLFLLDRGQKTVLEGVSAKLQELESKTNSEFNQARLVASNGIVEASGISSIENITDITLQQQEMYYNAVQEKIAEVADNVTSTLNQQNRTTNDSLDNLLSVSTDSMNRIMEFDNASLAILSNMASFNVNNFKTISTEGLKRLAHKMELFDSLLWKMQEDSLDDIDILWGEVFQGMRPFDTEVKRIAIRQLESQFDNLRINVETRQRELFKNFLRSFSMQSQVIAEEMRLLTNKVNFAINMEIENSTITQDENIEKVITELLIEKLQISDSISVSAGQVKKTISSLEEKLLGILQERSKITQENISKHSEVTKKLAEQAKDKVAFNISRSTEEALKKIEQTIVDSKNVIVDEMQRSSRQTMMYSLLITSLCTLAALGLSFFIVRSLTEPISNILLFAEKMSKGELSERLPEGHDEIGELGAALNYMADELVKLQESTLNSFNQTLDQVIDCVFVFEPETLLFTYVNHGVLLQVGYDREELYAMTPVDIKPDFTLERFRGMIMPLKNGEMESLLFTTKHQSKEGKLIPVEVFLKYVVPPGNDPRFIAIVRDISEREEAKREKEKIQTHLLHAQKLESVGQLAAGIAHEINTPTQFIGTNIQFLSEAYEDISSIMSEVDIVRQNGPEDISKVIENALLEHDWEFLSEEIPAAIRQTQDGVERVTNIVSAMKSFSHPGSKEMQLYNINDVIETTITVASNEWRYKADIKKDLDPTLPQIPMLVDEMGQVLLNLLVNSVHAITVKLGDNAEGVKGEIIITTAQLGDQVTITINDNGSGIPEEARPRIFDPFFTTKEVGKGTGQGLAISHDVVTQKHKGNMSFTSETGKGTSFTISLPLEQNRE